MSDKSTLLTHGLNFTQKPEGPLDRKVIGKAFETVGQDLENIDGRLANVETKNPVTDLGTGSSTMDVTGKEDGICAYLEGGEQKFGIIKNGKLFPLQGA